MSYQDTILKALQSPTERHANAWYIVAQLLKSRVSFLY